MKKLLLLGVCLLALSGHHVRAYASDPDIVVVRVLDVMSGLQFVIVRGEGKTEMLKWVER
jgi:hypothetical protein